MASTSGRRIVIPLTNKSGGSVAAGDVVVIDSANDGSFTTTTTARSEVSLGVAQETIANNATGRVAVAGYVALVNVPASVTRGHYIETHTVAKQATGNSTRRSGSFGQFLTGGTSPTGWLWGQTDQTATGSASLVEQETDHKTDASPDFTTASTTFVDVTGLSVTMTTAAVRCLILFTGVGNNSNAGQAICVDVDIDGTRVGGSDGLTKVVGVDRGDLSFAILTDVLSAASHVFKIQIRATANTAGLGASTTSPARFTVIETSLA